MEDSQQSGSDSLNARSRGEEVTLGTLVCSEVLEPEPSPAELAQCEAEVGTLLSIIAELNRKMGALEAPCDPEDSKPARPAVPLAPEYLTSSPSSCSPAERGGSGEVWSELQGVLSGLESSVSSRRTWALPHMAYDQDKQTEHLTAARESWVQVTQVLEEMEREFGISYPSGLPHEERQRYQKDILALHQRNCALRSTLQERQQELEGAKISTGEMEEETNKLQERLLSLHKVWRSVGSLSPPYSRSDSSSSGALSPGWASPPFPGSPLLLRRPAGAFPALSTGGDCSPLGSSRLSRASRGSPCPNPGVSLESETERLQRGIERLKARNERLTAALDRRKGESEEMSMTLSRHEADGSALEMALRYCEECEDTYSELLSLYEASKQQGIPLWRDTAESVKVKDRAQPSSPRPQLRSQRTEELSTSFSTPGGAVERETPEHTSLARASEIEGRVEALREQIERLKQNRAAVCVPKPGPGGEGKLSPDTGTLAGPRGQVAKDGASPHDTKMDKAALLYELVTVREEMSELRGLIRLTEKERRCLDWSLMAQKARDAAGALVAESLREELEDRRAEQQRLGETEAKVTSDGDIPGPRNRTILRELQAVMQREQLLKRRMSAVRGSLDSALSDSASHRRGGEEQMARLAQAHCKAAGTYRHARRKYREQLWRLERQAAAMSDRHAAQIGALRATLEALEWRREETVL